MSGLLLERTTAPRNGLPEWRPYVYRGTGVDRLTAFLDDPEPEEPVITEPCPCGGSMRGYRRHLADGEDACPESRFAVNDYHRERAREQRERRDARARLELATAQSYGRRP